MDAFINMINKQVALQTDNEVYQRAQVRLGDFIAGLEVITKTDKGESKRVYFDVLGLVPTGFDSYRGYYDHLAIGFKDEGLGPTVDELLAWAKEANGKTFQGYKGGDFTMNDKTPLWVANYGNSTDFAVMGLKDDGWSVTIETIKVKD